MILIIMTVVKLLTVVVFSLIFIDIIIIVITNLNELQWHIYIHK